MNPVERSVQVNGLPCRVWEAGQGEPVYYLAGLGGLPKWTPFLDRLAAKRRVILPSLPGFPGGLGHDLLDTHLDWMLAAEELLRGAGLSGHTPGDLIGASFGGALAADIAAMWPARVRRLVLIAPLGMFDEADPVTDMFALRPKTLPGLMCANPERYAALMDRPEGADEVEWQVMQARTAEAAARLLWPLADTGVTRRLRRILAPTLILWGDEDRVVPPGYAKRFAEGITGATQAGVIQGAGHLADLDAPGEVAAAILEFLEQTAPDKPLPR